MLGRLLVAHATASLCLSLGLSAQCPSPSIPSGGFQIVQSIDNVFTFTDGYQTQVDVRYPLWTPVPSCGWPTILFVHGGGVDKSSVAPTATRLAQLGYLTVTFDFRAQGPSYSLLNDPLVYTGTVDQLRERIDVFEMLELAEAAFPSLVDENLLGVTGGSQGGNYSWAAAAHSGRFPPQNPWRTARFPRISAVVPEAYIPDLSEIRIPGGNAFGEGFVRNLFSGGTVFSPSDLAMLQAFVLAEDFTGIHSVLYPSTLEMPPLLQTSSVPWAIGFSYDDRISIPDPVLPVFQSAPADIPHRLRFSTGNHGAPKNDGEIKFKQFLRIHWFDRFLRRVQNGVDQPPFVRMAVTPEDAQDYKSRSFVWDVREHVTAPPSTALQRYHLDDGGVLTTGMPTGVGSSRVTHRPAITLQGYTIVLPSVIQLQLQYIATSSQAFTTPVLSSDVHLHGQTKVHLEVSSPDQDVQIYAALFDVPLLGFERMVADGFVTFRGDLPPGRTAVELDIHIASYVFRKGHSLRLRIENYAAHRPAAGGAAGLRTLPIFTDFDLDVFHDGLDVSYIDLPIEPYVRPSLAVDQVQLDDNTLGDTTFALNSNSDHALDPYFIALGISGTSPGTNVAGTLVPLNFDTLTALMLDAPGFPPFSNFSSTLDAVGRGQATLLLGSVPSLGLAGSTLSAAGVVLDPVLGTLEASNAVDIGIVDY